MVVLHIDFCLQNLYIIIIAREENKQVLNPPSTGGRKKDKMRPPKVFDGKEWRNATMEEYNNELVNVPVYGKANFLFPNVWNLPIVNTNATTGSKVVRRGKSVQFRFSCARNTETAQAVRAYKLALDKDARAGVKFNYTKSGSCFVFETTFCGSVSALEKFLAFVNGRSSGIKSLQVRIRQEETKEVSEFKKFDYNNLTLSVVRYLRDALDVKDYNKIKVNQLEVVPSNNIYGLIVRL